MTVSYCSTIMGRACSNITAGTHITSKVGSIGIGPESPVSRSGGSEVSDSELRSESESGTMSSKPDLTAVVRVAVETLT